MMVNSARKPAATLDRIAATLSGLCLLHCLALPLLIAGLPVLSELSGGHFHAQMLTVAIPVSVIALGLGFRRHENSYVIAIGVLGMLLLVVGGTVAHSRYGLAADRSLSVAGALILAVAHYFNSRLSRHCRSNTSSDGRY